MVAVHKISQIHPALKCCVVVCTPVNKAAKNLKKKLQEMLDAFEPADRPPHMGITSAIHGGTNRAADGSRCATMNRAAFSEELQNAITNSGTITCTLSASQPEKVRKQILEN